MSTNSPLAQNCVIPAQAGIQQGQTSREAEQHQCFVRFAGVFIIWIPACAGMTG